ncbi:MFS general substrate transporter [Marasmius fiardii PR-910]|nr:MFS general substrate transporter [Marasmius fiardii PR-910]
MSEETSPLLNGQTNGSYTEPLPEVEAGHSTPEEPSKSQTYWSYLIPMGVGLFLAAMDQTIVVAAYASIGSELRELQRTSWIATAYMLTVTSFQPLYGKLSDIFGRKSCLLFAYTIFALGSLSCGLARNMTELILARGFAGIGGAGMSTIVSIVLSDVVPLRSRGTWQGYVNVIYTTGSVAGAPLGGFLVESIGWRWAFLIQTPITILAFILVSIFLKLPSVEKTDLSTKLKRIDFFGSLSLILTILSLLTLFDHGGNVSWTDTTAILSIIVFVLAAISFLAVEKWVAPEPIAPLHMIFNKSLIGAYFSNFFGVAVMMSTFFYVPLYLQAVQGMSASRTSFWLVFTVLFGLSGSLGGGFIIQAIGKFYAITVAAYAIMVVGTTLLLLAAGLLFESAIGIAIGFILTSIANGAGTTTLLVALISNAGKENQAVVTAASYLFRSLGGVIGVSLGNTIEQQVLRWDLKRTLEGQNVEEIIRKVRESLKYIDQLEPVQQVLVRKAYGEAVRAIFIFAVTASALAFLSSTFIKGKALAR